MLKLQWVLAGLAVPLWAGLVQASETPISRLSDAGAVVHRANQDLADSMVGAFRDSGLRDYAIDIEANDGVVTLSGSVASEEQRSLALDVAGAQAGVVGVTDRLQIAQSALVTVAFDEAPGAMPATTTEPAPIANFAGGVAPYSDAPSLPPYSWPAYTPYNNYASMAYQTQYPSGAWPFIGPPHPYPMIPSGWRRVTLKWRGGYWWLKFHAH